MAVKKSQKEAKNMKNNTVLIRTVLNKMVLLIAGLVLINSQNSYSILW